VFKEASAGRSCLRAKHVGEFTSRCELRGYALAEAAIMEVILYEFARKANFGPEADQMTSRIRALIHCSV
jgi:hypothetical protein